MADLRHHLIQHRGLVIEVHSDNHHKQKPHQDKQQRTPVMLIDYITVGVME